MNGELWYKDGLRFSCSLCGDCCTGTPGYVWLEDAEIAALAERLGSGSPESFEAEYVRRVGLRRSLREFPNGDCVFFDAERRCCSVYDVRPKQCRTWPFWGSNLKTPDDWAAVCEVCPGSGKGKPYTLDEILALRQLVKV